MALIDRILFPSDSPNGRNKNSGAAVTNRADSYEPPDVNPKTGNPGSNMANPEEFLKTIDECLTSAQLDSNAKSAIMKTITLNFQDFTATSRLQQRLDILYQHEKNYLSLVKEFKEEIKFVDSMQGDLRKERARFFSDTLKEVTAALKDAQVAPDVSGTWLEDLVSTYTQSLDLSAGLIEEHTADTIVQIRKKAQESVRAATGAGTDPSTE